MTDTYLAAAARIVGALADALDAADGWADARHVDVRTMADWLLLDTDDEDRAIAAVLLAAARRELAVPEVACPSCGATIRARLMDQPGALAEPQPRVWLPGDTIPAGSWAVDEFEDVNEFREHVTEDVLVELHVFTGDDFAAAVAAEQARRAGGAL